MHATYCEAYAGCSTSRRSSRQVCTAYLWLTSVLDVHVIRRRNPGPCEARHTACSRVIPRHLILYMRYSTTENGACDELPFTQGCTRLVRQPSTVELHPHRRIPVIQVYGYASSPSKPYKSDVPLASSALPACGGLPLPPYCSCPHIVKPPLNPSHDMKLAFALLSVALSALRLIGATRAQAPSPCLDNCLQSASACAPYVPSLFPLHHRLSTSASRPPSRRPR